MPDEQSVYTLSIIVLAFAGRNDSPSGRYHTHRSLGCVDSAAHAGHGAVNLRSRHNLHRMGWSLGSELESAFAEAEAVPAGRDSIRRAVVGAVDRSNLAIRGNTGSAAMAGCPDSVAASIGLDTAPAAAAAAAFAGAT